MRFLHTADWHIGKKLKGYHLQAEQEAAFLEIEKIASAEKVDAIVIAGDVYDRGMAAESDVALVNQMFQKLNLTDQYPLLVISGNHDSAERLATGSQWYQATNFYLKTEFKDVFESVVLDDTQFFLLPYFELSAARNYYGDQAEIKNVAQAMELVVADLQKLFLPDKKHVLVAHFFAAGSTKTDSETNLTVGGLDIVPLDCLEVFDYVALGHLHYKNALTHPTIKYSGTPIKFSTSESQHQKGVWIVDTETMEIEFKEIKPVNDLIVIEGSFAEITEPEFYQQYRDDDFIAIRLTDQEPIINVMERLRACYPKILEFTRVGQKSPQTLEKEVAIDAKKEPLEMLASFYQQMTQQELTEEQLTWALESLMTIQGGQHETD
ncbi:exonuclease SbcCD subunit D [Ligilactobacillus ceti]|uniref:Nuclease SbcCD subunit D n=1 Tax=Ligilactobacillus ceti DSM 22408 TaxID=1122146 RepID=A0A0R2KIW7_9LACO|nr:exonuclease SbcCD subunit D [Ligilactobacillus ceti]KRN89265.1 exonuclease SbcD [Ligilactobacillus ceti DSM 22408]